MKYTTRECGGQIVVLEFSIYDSFVGKKCKIQRKLRTLVNEFLITDIETGRSYTQPGDHLLYCWKKEEHPEYFL